MRKPELLAPAGSPEAALAAARCGADAVYLGMGAFNARRHAQNFGSTAALKSTVDYCHCRGVKVYLTLNTLIREDEMEDALNTAKEAAIAGVDAYIVQDLGLAKRLREMMPSVRLHASTQLSCHSPEGVLFLKQAGFSRVVLAREMSAEEIRACAGLGAELEVFVHGALCMCVSGQCYLSAMLGGRSGNRGACAQPCRLPFSSSGCIAENDYALSLKDLSLTNHIDGLTDCGVASLKIEGRMKRPEYVAAATTVCRAAVDGTKCPVDSGVLQAVFSRSGFTDGYFTGERTDMFGIRRKEDVEAAPAAFRILQQLYEKERRSLPLTMRFSLEVGQPMKLIAEDADHNRVTVLGEPGERAVNKPLDAERAKVALCKTGGTPFFVSDISAEIGSCATAPISAVNDLRRQAIEQLSEKRIARPKPVFRDPKTETQPPLTDHVPKIVLRLSSVRQLPPGISADAIILPLADFAGELPADHPPLIAEIPRGLFENREKIRTLLAVAGQKGATHALCQNVGAIPLAAQAGLIAIGGFGLNVMNRETAAFLENNGVKAVTLSMELTFAQMAFGSRLPIPAGLLVYGRQPLMLMRNCPRRGGKTCGKTGCRQGLVDRKGKRFPLACSNGCTELLNADVLYFGDKTAELPRLDFWLFHFTDESAEQVSSVVSAYQHGNPPCGDITRGLYRRGLLE